MAARKITAPKSSSSEARGFAVVLEEMRSHFKVFGEGQQLLRDQMDRRFEQVDRRFDRVEHDIAEIRQDITEIRQDVTEIRQDMGRVKVAVLEHSRELKEIRMTLDKKVDRDEVEGIVHRAVRDR